MVWQARAGGGRFVPVEVWQEGRALPGTAGLAAEDVPDIAASAVGVVPAGPEAGERRRTETESEDEGLEEAGPVVPELVASSGEDQAGTESEDEGLEEADGQAEAGEADLSRVD